MPGHADGLPPKLGRCGEATAALLRRGLEIEVSNAERLLILMPSETSPTTHGTAAELSATKTGVVPVDWISSTWLVGRWLRLGDSPRKGLTQEPGNQPVNSSFSL